MFLLQGFAYEKKISSYVTKSSSKIRLIFSGVLCCESKFLELTPENILSNDVFVAPHSHVYLCYLFRDLLKYINI